MREYGFSMTRILPYKDRIVEEVALSRVSSIPGAKKLQFSMKAIINRIISRLIFHCDY